MKRAFELESSFEKFIKAKVFISDQWLQEIKAEYVYASNRLEGNALTLLETKTIIDDRLSLSGKKMEDILETLGHYRALNTLITFVRNKYPLTEKVIRQFSENLLTPVFHNTDKLHNYRVLGQVPGNYKIKTNKIRYRLDGNEGEIIPFSNEHTIEENMGKIFLEFNQMEDLIEKAAYLSFQIFHNQPFPDGNKRVARLAVTYTMMSFGYPLVSFRGLGTNFNEALLRAYFSKSLLPLTEYIVSEYTQRLHEYISAYSELSKKKKPPTLDDGLALVF